MIKKLLALFIILNSIFHPLNVYADWPMAGHDNQRTSYSAESLVLPTGSCGYHAFDSYIPSKAQIITVDRGSSSMIYIPTAKGVYALKSTGLTNSQSDILWFYATPRPVGHSPTVEKATNIMYIPSLDKTIHAVNATTGQFLWQTAKAGGSFITSPLVANGKVYAGNRDGYFYAFNAATGALDWYYKTGGPIEYSAALSADGQRIYFASNDMHAYSLNASNGLSAAVSAKFQGHGFHSFWPVYYTNPGRTNRVLFPKAGNYPENFLGYRQQEAQLSTDPNPMPIDTFVAYHTKYPDRETLLILDTDSLLQQEKSPYLWWGNPTGNRYPPSVLPDGRIFDIQNWANTGSVPFGQGGYTSWRIGDVTMQLLPNYMREAGDEPRAHSVIGTFLAFGHGGDGADTFGFTNITTPSSAAWSNGAIFGTWGKWYQYWNKFAYGNWLTINYNAENQVRWWGSTWGTHGNQSTIVPLNGKTYIHRSNAILCIQ